jgi:hypothetical protein
VAAWRYQRGSRSITFNLSMQPLQPGAIYTCRLIIFFSQNVLIKKIVPFSSLRFNGMVKFTGLFLETHVHCTGVEYFTSWLSCGSSPDPSLKLRHVKKMYRVLGSRGRFAPRVWTVSAMYQLSAIANL